MNQNKRWHYIIANRSNKLPYEYWYIMYKIPYKYRYYVQKIV